LVSSSRSSDCCEEEKDLLIHVNKTKTELSQLNNLEILSVSGNQIVALPEWIGSLPRLRELYMDNNRLRELPNRLTIAPELTMISVCSNRSLFALTFCEISRLFINQVIKKSELPI